MARGGLHSSQPHTKEATVQILYKRPFGIPALPICIASSAGTRELGDDDGVIARAGTHRPKANSVSDRG